MIRFPVIVRLTAIIWFRSIARFRVSCYQTRTADSLKHHILRLS